MGLRDRAVVRIDPATNEITDEVAFDTGQVWGRLAFRSGSVWAIGTEDGVPNQLVRIDPVGMTASAIPLRYARRAWPTASRQSAWQLPRTGFSCASIPTPER